jgi:DNA-binding protein YbaB
MFDKLRQGAEAIKALNKLRHIRNELSKLRITVEENGIRVVVSGDMKIKELNTNGQSDDKIKDVLNKAFEKTQKEVAKTMQEMGGGLGGLFGGLS